MVPKSVEANKVPMSVPLEIRPPGMDTAPLVWLVLPRSSVPPETVRVQVVAPRVPPPDMVSVPALTVVERILETISTDRRRGSETDRG